MFVEKEGEGEVEFGVGNGSEAKAGEGGVLKVRADVREIDEGHAEEEPEGWRWVGA